ncbi:IS630 family transposase [Streptomyces sp. NBC_01637]|nr:IS630 family transposase [Streptomyces sp. NBC_01637]
MAVVATATSAPRTRRRPGRTARSPRRSPTPCPPRSPAPRSAGPWPTWTSSRTGCWAGSPAATPPTSGSAPPTSTTSTATRPPGAVVLSIDEKPAIAARSRRHPGRPAAPGHPVREEFEYRRHGTASLVAALDVTTGEVLTEIIARNDTATFTAFLDRLDAVIAPDREVHVVLDNGSSHTAKHTRKWLASHPRWTVHWPPPLASWLNQVELFFSALTCRVLRHGDFPGRDDLIDKLDTYAIGHHTTAKPYRWTYGSPLKAARPASTCGARRAKSARSRHTTPSNTSNCTELTRVVTGSRLARSASTASNTLGS